MSVVHQVIRALILWADTETVFDCQVSMVRVGDTLALLAEISVSLVEMSTERESTGHPDFCAASPFSCYLQDIEPT